MRVSATGHRKGDFNQMYMLSRMWMILHKPGVICTGMAQGWDMAVACAAINLGIPVEAYVPFKEQCWRWPQRDYQLHAWILERCVKVEIVCSGIAPAEAFKLRNVRLVEVCDYMLAWYDGQGRSGTAHALNRAAERGIDFVNLYR